MFRMPASASSVSAVGCPQGDRVRALERFWVCKARSVSRLVTLPWQAHSFVLQEGLLAAATSKADVMAASDVQPVSVKKRVLPLSYDRGTSPDCRSFSRLLSASAKKLKRLPHLFGRVLELPVEADSCVDVQEDEVQYRFSIEMPGLVADDIRAEAIEIVPGATKVVIRGAEKQASALEDLERDLWRFRLPPETQPCSSTATYENGCLVVTVPIAPPSVDTEATGDDCITLPASDGCRGAMEEAKMHTPEESQIEGILQPDSSGLEGGVEAQIKVSSSLESITELSDESG